jgi:hypothetical protein
MNRSQPETLDDLLRHVPDDRFRQFCLDARVPERSLHAMRRGLQQRPKVWIVASLADALAMPVERVRAAIDASRSTRSGLR